MQILIVRDRNLTMDYRKIKIFTQMIKRRIITENKTKLDLFIQTISY